MSADAWYNCPFCIGKKHPEYEQEEQVRADYEIWISDKGIWNFRGVATCSTCNRSWVADIHIHPILNTDNKTAWKIVQSGNVSNYI